MPNWPHGSSSVIFFVCFVIFVLSKYVFSSYVTFGIIRDENFGRKEDDRRGILETELCVFFYLFYEWKTERERDGCNIILLVVFAK